MSVESSAQRRAVFLSYASQDADAARKIADALRGAHVEVWFDQSELRGGDAWDAKIRGQIASCALFLPVISGATQSRREGYFRLEWKLAAQRTHMMSERTAFLLPVVVDATRDAEADVPGEFKAVQWTRLPGGETSEAFCARVKQLLAGELGPRTPSSASWTNADEDVRSHQRKKSHRWIMPALAGTGVVVALAMWHPWSPRIPAATPPAAPPPSAASAPLSEARQLTLKARALIDDDLLAVRENFRLAEELCQRATTLDPTDAEAWATLARVSLEILGRNYESTPQRREAARSQAERAIRLAPNSIEAGLAMATQVLHLQEWADAEARFRRLLEIAPRDARVALGLSQAVARAGRVDEASEIRLNHPAFGGRDPRPLVGEAARMSALGRLSEAKSLIERAQALAPTTRGYYMQLLQLVSYWADFDAAQKLLALIPSQVLQEDGLVSVAAALWLRAGDGDKALAVLGRSPRDFLEEGTQILPRSYLTGTALQLTGRTEAARVEWTQALAVVEKRLNTDPNRSALLRLRSLLLALLGRVDEGESWWRIVSEMPRENNVNSPYHGAMFYAAAGREDEAIRWLERADAEKLPIWQQTSVRFDPVFSSVRKDRRVQQMMSKWAAEVKAVREPGSATPSPGAARPAPAASAASVAVLAFADMSPQKDAEYFSDGISEELLNVLAKVPGLKVTARTSAFHFKGKDTPIPEIAKQLGVAYVVEGSVRKAGNRVRITAQLIKAADGFHVWSDNFDRELKDIFAVQDEIAGLIAKNLALKLGTGSPGGTIVATQTRNLAAYDAYLRGRALQTGAVGPARGSGTGGSASHFEEAVRLDPDYALAWARISQVRLAGRTTGFDRGEARAAQARTAAETAVRLAPELPEARLAMAMIRLHVDQDHEAAQRELAEAERRRPNDAEVAMALAQLEWVRGQWGPRAAALVMRAVELDPQNIQMMDTNCQIQTETGRFAEAEWLCRRWLSLSPGNESALLRQSRNHLTWTGDQPGALAFLQPVANESRQFSQRRWMARGALYAGLRDFAAAAGEYRRVAAPGTPQGRNSGPRGNRCIAASWLARFETVQGNTAKASELAVESLALARQFVVDFPDLAVGASYLAISHAIRAEKADALAAIDRAMQTVAQTRDASQIARMRRTKAEVLTLLGEKDAAIAELRAVHAMGFALGYRLRAELEWEPLRSDPKFQQLMKEAEAQADAQPRLAQPR